MLRDYKVQKDRMIQCLKEFPWHSREAVGDYLSQTYYYVRHSERLLALAAAHLGEADRQLQRRMFQHLSEEDAHDLMVRKDLELLGFTLDDFPERPETKMFWETQYYKIQHEDPMILMGYILLLEDVASDICLWMSQQIKQHHTKGTTFLRVHGEEDPEHVDEALKLINSLSEARQERIFSNLLQSELAYEGMIRAIVEHNLLQTQKKAA